MDLTISRKVLGVLIPLSHGIDDVSQIYPWEEPDTWT